MEEEALLDSWKHWMLVQPHRHRSVPIWDLMYQMWRPLEPHVIGSEFPFFHWSRVVYFCWSFFTITRAWKTCKMRVIQVKRKMSFLLQRNKGCVTHTVALPFTLKTMGRQKKNDENSNISPCKSYNLQKNLI
jgi:hypothetical protein